MLEWAADPDRGNLLPTGFRNPFTRRARQSRQVASNLLRELDISIAMAVDLLQTCDRFQLTLFAPLVIYGLRPGELGWLFHENIHDGWIRVVCLLELDYVTKGRREKAFPLIDPLKRLWETDGPPSQGLVYVHRRARSRKGALPLLGKPLAAIVDEYRRCCHRKAEMMTAEQRRKVRTSVMKDAGQLNYDYVEAEFKKLARRLDWPGKATLKDLRHLFATSLENAGVPEFYRRYLMGQAFGRDPIVAYTHVTSEQVEKHFEVALRTELAPLVAAVESRSSELRIGQPL